MPPRPSYIAPEVLQQARSTRFQQDTDRDLWSMAWKANEDAEIGSLASILDQPEPQRQPDPLDLTPDPLPVVVSPRPGAEQPQDDILGPEFSDWRPEQPQPIGDDGSAAVETLSDRRQDVAGPLPDPSGQPSAMPTGAHPSTLNRQGANAHVAPHLDAIEQVAAEEGVPADALAALMEVEDSPDNVPSPAGARGRMQVIPGQGYDLPGEDASDPLTSIRQGARALKDKFRIHKSWEEAGRAYFGYGVDAGGMRTDVYGQRYDEARRRYQQPQQGPQPTTPMQAEESPQAQRQAFGAGNYTPNQISAATSEGLDYETALAVCGPAAAIAFARKNGRNPTMQEALGLAREVGWTAQAGMAGPASQQQLLTRMGVASRLVDGVPDWRSVATDVQRGNPVTISTPGHYFVAERYDPESGSFDFGESARVLKASGGKRWFRPEELPGLGMGEPRASLFIDSPESPSPSVVAGRVSLTAGASPSSAAPSSPPPAGVDPLLDAGSGAPDDLMLRQPNQPHTGDSFETGEQPWNTESTGPRPQDNSATGSRLPMDSTPSISAQDSPAPSAADPTINLPEYTQGPWQQGQTTEPLGPEMPPEQRISQPGEVPLRGPLPESEPVAPPSRFGPPVSQQQEGVFDPVAILGQAGEAGRRIAAEIDRAGRDASGQINPWEAYQAIMALPFDVVTRARRELVADAEARAASGIDPVAPFRALGIPLPSAEELNPEGRPASDVIVGGVVQAAMPDPFLDPLTEGAMRTAGAGLGLAARGARAGARVGSEAVQQGARAVGEAVQGAGTRVSEGMRANQGRVAALDAQMAHQGSSVAPGVFGVSGLTPDEPAVRGMRPRVVPPEVADTLDFPVRIPEDPRAIRAIEAAGGTIDDRGVTLGVTRAQSPAGAGQSATRGGVFYEAIPEGGRSSYGNYADDPKGVGGTQVIPRTQTRFRSPLILEDAPGSRRGFDDAMHSMFAQRAEKEYQEAVTRHGGTVEQLRARRDALAGPDTYEVYGRSGDLIHTASTRDEAVRWVSNATDGIGGYDIARAPSPRTPEWRAADQALQEVFQAQSRIGEAARRAPTTGRIEEDIHKARSAGPEGSPERAAALKDLVTRYGGDPNLIDDLLKIRGADASESNWAIKENILAAHARRQGYDGVVTVQAAGDPVTALDNALKNHPQIVALGSKVQKAKDNFDLLSEQYDNAIADFGQDSPQAERLAVRFERVSDALDNAQMAYQKRWDALADTIEVEVPHKITELVDVREGRNPTPGDQTEQWNAAHMRVLDISEQMDDAAAQMDHMERYGSDDDWRSARSQWEYVRKLFDKAVDEREAFRGVPGYTLRSDVPRRPDPGSTTAQATAGVAARAGGNALAQVNADLGSAVAGSGVGASTEVAEAMIEGRDIDPQEAQRRATIGAVASPLIGRGVTAIQRRAGVRGGGALATPGVSPGAGQPNPVSQIAQQIAQAKMTGPHTNQQHMVRNIARGIQQAQVKNAVNAASPPIPGLPTPPPNAPVSWWDVAQTWRYGVGLFGNVSTALMQTAGGLAEVGLGAPAEIIRQAIIRGHPEHVPLIAWEALKSPVAGVKSAGETIAGRVPQTIMTGTDYRPPTSERMTPGSAGRAAVFAAETPGRIATQAPDALWYEVFYRTGLAQAAAEEAQKTVSRWNPVASVQAQRQLIQNPTPEVMARAHQFAQDSTYKGDLGTILGSLETAIRGGQGASEKRKAIGSILMPVYHTIARIHEGALEFTPGIGALPLNRAGLAAKGRPLDQKAAQQVMAVGLFGSMMGYAASGGVRGPGPDDAEKRKMMMDDGYIPNTTNIGGYWVPNQYFGRAGPILNAIGSLNDAVLYNDPGKGKFSEQSLQHQTEKILKNLGRSFRDYPFVEAIATLTELADDPVTALSKFAGDTASTFSPALYRTYATATDQKVRRPDRGEDISPLQTATDTFQQRSGIGRQSLPVAQDVLGREVENQRQGVAALFPRVGKDRRDPIIAAYLDPSVGVDIGKPPTSFTEQGVKIEMTPEQQRAYQRYMGEFIEKGFDRADGTSDRRRTVALRELYTNAREHAQTKVKADIGRSEIRERVKAGAGR